EVNKLLVKKGRDIAMLGFMFFIFLAIGVIFLIKIKVTNKGIALFEKVMTAVLSAFIFSAFVVYSIVMLIIVALIFSFLIFLSICGFLSFFIDVYIIVISLYLSCLQSSS